MIDTFNIVDDTTGMIMTQIGVDLEHDPDGVVMNTPVGHTAYVGEASDSPDAFYYVGGVKTPRPLFASIGSWDKTAIDADGVDAATFSSGLPVGTEVIVMVPLSTGLTQPGPVEVNDGSFSLSTPIAGRYIVGMSAFPYIPSVTEIIAT